MSNLEVKAGQRPLLREDELSCGGRMRTPPGEHVQGLLPIPPSPALPVSGLLLGAIEVL